MTPMGATDAISESPSKSDVCTLPGTAWCWTSLTISSGFCLSSAMYCGSSSVDIVTPLAATSLIFIIFIIIIIMTIITGHTKENIKNIKCPDYRLIRRSPLHVHLYHCHYHHNIHCEHKDNQFFTTRIRTVGADLGLKSLEFLFSSFVFFLATSF